MTSLQKAAALIRGLHNNDEGEPLLTMRQACDIVSLIEQVSGHDHATADLAAEHDWRLAKERHRNPSLPFMETDDAAAEEAEARPGQVSADPRP